MLEFDEQLYLLIGDRLLHGSLPYVELWDRKPIGLFLFYAVVRMLGGTGIIQYQIAATLCVAITGSLIWAMARRAAGPIASFGAALCYILLLMTFHGTGGQSPVIYNVLTAIAAWCAFRSNDTDSPARIARLALIAMAMMGTAIQFKYTPVVEGMFFGCYFLWRFWRIHAPIAWTVSVAMAMILVALLPTIAAIGFYAATGHLDAFFQANFLSIFQRHPFPAQTRGGQETLTVTNGLWIILLIPVAIAWRWFKRRSDEKPDFPLILGWIGAALVGFGLLGDFYDFYFITVLLPACILIAPLMRPSRVGFALGCLLLFWPMLSLPSYAFKTGLYQRVAGDLTTAIRPYVQDRCLYVYDGPAVLYLLTNSCAPTRFIYPDHLTNPTEAPALGVDPAAEETRLLATRPGAIVTASSPPIPHVNPATQQLVRAALARDYVLVARVPSPDRIFYVWALRSLHPGPSPIRGASPNMPF
ncbi:ArnT family glycosyltransferase [Sphingomonas abietis]|uniref:Glycosyltransferase family 39 protein n=1 Tax=Sphingomonas abietis TaxID=3012344 RepID=A0ABY7NJH6_9SPHN|nr:glycosyltransferase family 39 protein [Sphingomonas abietis]WBO20970.1 glycosyltransferase family 39 protein [Sphingomonas abietis]